MQTAVGSYLETRLRALGQILGAGLLAMMLVSTYSLPAVMAASDYVSAFYVAGRLAASGEMHQLYPDENATSFIGESFDRAAHEFLPSIAPEVTAMFMYPPIVAWLFAPLSVFDPVTSLLLWQIVSVCGLVLSCRLISHPEGGYLKMPLLSVLYLPTLISIWIGQVTVIFGVLPLSAGYALARRGRPLACGLLWSLLSLKPPLLFAAGFVALVMGLGRKFRCLIGLVAGTLCLTGLNLIVTERSVNLGWVRALGLADQLVTSDLYAIPTYLVTSLPLNLLLLLPVGQRAIYQILIYAFAAGIVLFSLWCIRRRPESTASAGWALSLALVLLPLISPHMLYYDLALLLPAGVLILSGRETSVPSHVYRLALLTWLGVSGYLIAAVGLSVGVVRQFGTFPFIHAVLLALWVALLGTMSASAATGFEGRADKREAAP